MCSLPLELSEQQTGLAELRNIVSIQECFGLSIIHVPFAASDTDNSDGGASKSNKDIGGKDNAQEA